MAKLVCIALFVLLLDASLSDPLEQRSIRVNKLNETYVLFMGDGANFDSANEICRSQFGGSAIIRNRNDQQFLTTWLQELSLVNVTSGREDAVDHKSFNTWLGARYLRENGGKIVWQTFHEFPLNRNAFWAPREPRCYSSCCGVAIDQNGGWHSIPCHWNAQVLCKMSKSDSERYIESLQGERVEKAEAPVLHNLQALTGDAANSTEARQSSQLIRLLFELQDTVQKLSHNVSDLYSQLEEERIKRQNETDTLRATIGKLQSDFGSSLNSLEKKIRRTP